MNINKIKIEFFEKNKGFIGEESIDSIETIMNLDELKEKHATFLIQVPTSSIKHYSGDVYFNKETNEIIVMSFYTDEFYRDNQIAISKFGYYVLKKLDKFNDYSFFYEELSSFANIKHDLIYWGNIYLGNLDLFSELLKEVVDESAISYFYETILDENSMMYKTNRQIYINYNYEIVNADGTTSIIEGYNNLSDLSLEKLFHIVSLNEYDFLLKYDPTFYTITMPNEYWKLQNYVTRNGAIQEKIFANTLFVIVTDNKKIIEIRDELTSIINDSNKDFIRGTLRNMGKVLTVFDNEKGKPRLLSLHDIKLIDYCSFIDLTNKDNYYQKYQRATSQNESFYIDEYIKSI